MKSLAIIGSTGSIGKSSLEVYKKNKNKFNLLYLAANSNYKKLVRQSKIYKPKNIFLINYNSYLKNKTKNKLLKSENFIFKSQTKKIDYVISGVSSFEAIDINFKLIKIAKNLLIANKETIVCGGEIFLKEAKKNKCNIIPIDSEHHCIDYFIKNFKLKNEIDKIYITASGGPFLRKKINYKEKINKVLKHPTWKMGTKITVDSSTFANKILELFEAKTLFKLPSKKLKIMVEEKSNVHSVILLKNKIMFPIIHRPSMTLPISNSLNVSNNCDLKVENLKINLFPVDSKKFPIVKLGYKILKQDSLFQTILFVVLNERLVKKYIRNEINYGDIASYLVKAFKKKIIKNKSRKPVKNLNDIKKAISFGNSIVI